MTNVQNTCDTYTSRMYSTYSTANMPFSLLAGLFTWGPQAMNSANSEAEAGIYFGLTLLSWGLGITSAPVLLTAEVLFMAVATICVALPLTVILPFQLLYSAIKDCATASANSTEESYVPVVMPNYS